MADGARRERLLTFLLLPAVVVSVVTIVVITFRTSFQLEQLRERSVVEATWSVANEKADRLDKLIIKQDDVIAGEVETGDLETLGERWLDVAQRQTPTVRAVLVMHLRPPLRDVIVFASRAPGPEDERFRRLLVYQMLEDLVLAEEPRDQLRHLHKSYDGQSYLISYWQRRHKGQQYLVVAWHDVPRIVHELFPILYSERDRQSQVNVVDAQGRIVFGPPLAVGQYAVGRPFETTLYKWRLNVALTSAEELAENVERRRVLEMVLVGLSGLIMIAGIIVVLVAAARERRLSRLKSDFVANVSHELKTPLSLVRMFSELLESGRVESDEKRRQYLSIIVKESERLQALIENVLDFARVERGRVAYDFVEGGVDDVVARAVEACRTRAEREGVRLAFEVAGDVPRTKRDEGAVEMAVINLVDNALKYGKGTAEVRVDVIPRARFIEVRVADQGPGVPEEERKRIFDRFERGRRARDEKVRGSGIGLALVKHIAEAHGGRAWVETASPHGSVFVFSLKLQGPATASSPARDSLAPAE